VVTSYVSPTLGRSYVESSQTYHNLNGSFSWHKPTSYMALSMNAQAFYEDDVQSRLVQVSLSLYIHILKVRLFDPNSTYCIEM
jgi:hypothetical protein